MMRVNLMVILMPLLPLVPVMTMATSMAVSSMLAMLTESLQAPFLVHAVMLVVLMTPLHALMLVIPAVILRFVPMKLAASLMVVPLSCVWLPEVLMVTLRLLVMMSHSAPAEPMLTFLAIRSRLIKGLISYVARRMAAKNVTIRSRANLGLVNMGVMNIVASGMSQVRKQWASRWAVAATKPRLLPVCGRQALRAFGGGCRVRRLPTAFSMRGHPGAERQVLEAGRRGLDTRCPLTEDALYVMVAPALPAEDAVGHCVSAASACVGSARGELLLGLFARLLSAPHN